MRHPVLDAFWLNIYSIWEDHRFTRARESVNKLLEKEIKKMRFGWNQLWGIGAIVIGMIWIIKRNVPIGLESRPPSFFAKGKWAIFLGVFAIILGLFIGLEIPKQIRIDRCLDSGGSYNYITDKCINGKSDTKKTGKTTD